MLVNIYSVFDHAAKAFVKPFFVHNDGLAIRAFQDNVNAQDDNNIAKHPDQFVLYCLGVYDDVTGVINSCDPVRIAMGVELVNPTETTKLETILNRFEKLISSME
jgi:hypothetical protein